VNGLEVSATIDNIFDRKYFDPTPLELRQPILQQDGRTFWVKLTYRY
jgi:outer membrane receptor protein involved in Fe transport